MAGYYTQTVSYWELQNQYQPVSGKYMGIWVEPSVISWSTAYNKYGFREIFVDPASTSSGTISSALGIGFQSQHIMYYLGTDSPMVAQRLSQLGSTSVGYYYVDEPYDHNFYTGALENFENYVAANFPNAKFIISDEYWPHANICQGWMTSAGTVNNYLTTSNSGVMCDQYTLSNSCGDMKAFWNEFWNYYHPVHSWMNWADNTGLNAGGWPSCFDWMNAHGFSEVWLYAASNTGDEGVIQNWCVNAWEKAWLLRQEKYLTIIYQCSGLDCNWANQTGTWTVKTAYYTTTQYVSY
jgi:hypothetical protein